MKANGVKFDQVLRFALKVYPKTDNVAMLLFEQCTIGLFCTDKQQEPWSAAHFTCYT